MPNFSNIFTAARVFTAVTVLTGLAAFISGIAQVLPGTWPNYALAASGLLVKCIAVVRFLGGNSAWETSPAGQARAGGGTVINNFSNAVSADEVDDEPADVDGAEDAAADVTPTS